jgi:hypothetical protein
MIVTQMQIDDLLANLQLLRDRITFERDQVSNLEKSLAEAQYDYEQHLGVLNADSIKLEARKEFLRISLTRQTVSSSRLQPPSLVVPGGELLEAPLPTSVEILRKQKRRLADHIQYFIDPDQASVLEIINAVLIDDQRTVGEMLEVLIWGDIWAMRAAWESLEVQYARLTEWHLALEDRLKYWQHEMLRLEVDPRFNLYLMRRERGQTGWQEYLNELISWQTEENTRLGSDIADLEQQLEAKQSEGLKHA